MIGVSLFASAGIAETYLEEIGIEIIAANELLKQRAELYQSLYPKTKMICGNILDTAIFNKLLNITPNTIDLLIASPPCQGMSIAGKNRNITQMKLDERNYLIFRIIEFIKFKSPNYVLIENVPNFLKMVLPYNNHELKVVEILNIIFGDEYHIKANVYDSSNFGVAQNRMRAIIRMYKHGLNWDDPIEETKKVSVKDAIGHLPSLEAGQKSEIKWHFARHHSVKHIEWMRNTPTGKSAFENIKHFPVKSNGEKIKSYMTTYRRIRWDEPAPTITIRNDAISSQLNVHPGKYLGDGVYSDARVLTPLELFILSSLPVNWRIPDDTPELLIRKCIGECIPPLLIKKMISIISEKK